MRQLLLALLISGSAVGQPISIAPGALNFGVVEEVELDSLAVQITNNSWGSVHLGTPVFFSTYGNFCFSTLGGNVAIAPGSQYTFWVRFKPEHNILYNSEMVVPTEEWGSFSIDIQAQGRFSNSYYNPTENLSEQALKNALNTLLGQNTTDLGYDGARDQMYGNLDNVNGDVTCVYTGRVATFNTRAGANSNNFNCEHTFPQSFFSQAVPMRSDIHHLFSTDVTANSQRGNLPFGVVTGTPSWQNGGSKLGGGVFEPRDLHKGSAARALMYFVVRYQDYGGFFAPQETILRQWHDLFPPTTSDSTRNAGIFALQGNRNPFIDYPQFIERITSLANTSNAAPTSMYWKSADTLSFLGSDGDTAWVHWVLYNHGNTNLDIENMVINGGQVQSAISLADVSLLPGESLEIPFFLHPVQPLVGSHTFTYSDPVTSGTTTLYFSSSTGLGLSSAEPDALPGSMVVNSMWIPDFEVGEYELYALNGQLVRAGGHQAGALLPEGIQPGMYLLYTKKPHRMVRLYVAE